MINKYLILIFISGLCGGSVYPLIKIAESYDIPKFSYIFWESLIIVIILSSIALIKNERQFFKIKAFSYYIFCAVTNIIIPQSLFFFIASKVPTNILSIIIVLTPTLVYMASILLLKEKVCRNKTVGVIIGLLGICVLFTPSLLNNNYTISWHWIAISLLIPINYAVNRVYVSKFIPENNTPYSLAIGLFSLVTIISFILMIFTDQIYIPWEKLHYGDLALLLHATFMVIFYIIFFILAKTSSLLNSLSLYIAPLIGISWGYLFFNEIFDLIFIFSSIMVFLGLYLVTKNSKR